MSDALVMPLVAISLGGAAAGVGAESRQGGAAGVGEPAGLSLVIDWLKVIVK